MNITILGAGAWGTALAISLSARHRVTLWTRDATQIETMRVSRCNQRYLPKIPLPQEINLTADFPAACAHAEFILLAVPIAALRATLQQIVQATVRARGDRHPADGDGRSPVRPPAAPPGAGA